MTLLLPPRKRPVRKVAALLILSLAGHAIGIANPPPPPPKAAFSLADLQAQVPQNKQGAFLLEVPDICNSGGDPEVQAVLAGKTVETVGQVMPDATNNPDGKRLRVVRSLIVCCALHPKQYAAVLEFPGKAPAFKEMSWIKVVGTIAYRNESGKIMPIVSVTNFNETPQPANLMLH